MVRPAERTHLRGQVEGIVVPSTGTKARTISDFRVKNCQKKQEVVSTDMRSLIIACATGTPTNRIRVNLRCNPLPPLPLWQWSKRLCQSDSSTSFPSRPSGREKRPEGREGKSGKALNPSINSVSTEMNSEGDLF